MGCILWLVLVWESWAAPMGRWGPYAFPLTTDLGGLYAGDGRRIWQLERGAWREILRLPEEVRTGASFSGDTILLGGLNVIYWGRLPSLSPIRISGIGWIYRLWVIPSGIAAQGTHACAWVELKGNQLKVSYLKGRWVGVSKDKALLLWQDSLQFWPTVHKIKLPRQSWVELVQQYDGLWGITERGEVYKLSGLPEKKAMGRFWVGPYLATENTLLACPNKTVLWESSQPLYAGVENNNSGVVCLITPTSYTVLYPRVPVRWVMRWNIPITNIALQESRWTAWQGETALFPTGSRRYSATLIQAALYQGYWIWATPIGLLEEKGNIWAERNKYVSAVASEGNRIAWAVGSQVVIRIDNKEYRYDFKQPIHRLGWEGGCLWAWRSSSLYKWEEKQWQTFSLAFQPEEGVFYGGQWYFRTGLRWLRVRGSVVEDTLSIPPWLTGFPPIPFEWGKPLMVFKKGDTLFLATSLGLLAYVPQRGYLPPLRLVASLKGPGLKVEKKGHLSLPQDKSFIELEWDTKALFLPELMQVWTQVGENPPYHLKHPFFVFALSRPGLTKVRVWASHPWYKHTPQVEWEIYVLPPWYDTWTARLGILFILGLGILGAIALREWNHRRIQARLA
ncbi:MAG: hypothetical protein NZ933_06400, partial [Bacteroidia bacterium]|nr:hypothetical protein [Bacteroidia bacterium]